MWKPGQTPNPNGRPKGFSARAAMRRDWAEKGEEDPDGIGAVAREFATRMTEAARSCDEIAVSVIAKVIQEVEGPQRQEVQIEATTTSRIQIAGLEDDEVGSSGE